MKLTFHCITHRIMKMPIRSEVVERDLKREQAVNDGYLLPIQ